MLAKYTLSVEVHDVIIKLCTFSMCESKSLQIFLNDVPFHMNLDARKPVFEVCNRPVQIVLSV